MIEIRVVRQEADGVLVRARSLGSHAGDDDRYGDLILPWEAPQWTGRSGHRCDRSSDGAACVLGGPSMPLPRNRVRVGAVWSHERRTRSGPPSRATYRLEGIQILQGRPCARVTYTIESGVVGDPDPRVVSQGEAWFDLRLGGLIRLEDVSPVTPPRGRHACSSLCPDRRSCEKKALSGPSPAMGVCPPEIRGSRYQESRSSVRIVRRITRYGNGWGGAWPVGDARARIEACVSEDRAPSADPDEPLSEFLDESAGGIGHQGARGDRFIVRTGWWSRELRGGGDPGPWTRLGDFALEREVLERRPGLAAVRERGVWAAIGSEETGTWIEDDPWRDALRFDRSPGARARAGQHEIPALAGDPLMIGRGDLTEGKTWTQDFRLPGADDTVAIHYRVEAVGEFEAIVSFEGDWAPVPVEASAGGPSGPAGAPWHPFHLEGKAEIDLVSSGVRTLWSLRTETLPPEGASTGGTQRQRRDFLTRH